MQADVTASAGDLVFRAYMEDDFLGDAKLIMSKHIGHLRGARRRDFEFLGLPASDFEGAVGKDDRQQHFRIFVQNKRVYFMSVEGPKNAVHPATAQEFFTSFKLLERPSLNLPAADPKVALENLTEHPVQPSFGIPDMTFSPKGDLLAITTQCGLVHLWGYPAMKPVAQLAAARKTGASVSNIIQKAVFSPDGKLLAVAGGEDYTIKLFDVATRKEKGFLIVGQFVYSLAFFPDGKHLAVARSDNSTILIWNVDTKKQVEQWKFFDDTQPRALQASPDGKFIASGGMRGRVLCWDLEVKRPFRHFSTQDFYGVTALAFRADGNLLAFGSEDKRVRVMNVLEAGILYTLDGHAGDVLTVAFAPDGRTLVSGGDKTLRFWSMAKGSEIHTELLGDIVQSVVFSRDGAALLAATRDGTISKWAVRAP
jgi:WD40 repeat protein